MTYGYTGPHPVGAPAPPSVDPARPIAGTVAPRADSALTIIRPAPPGIDLARADDPAWPEVGPVSCPEASSADAERRIAQLLSDAVSHLITAGFDLASVHARLPRTVSHRDLELVTENLDAALVDIRSLAVRIALGTDPLDQEDQEH